VSAGACPAPLGYHLNAEEEIMKNDERLLWLRSGLFALALCALVAPAAPAGDDDHDEPNPAIVGRWGPVQSFDTTAVHAVHLPYEPGAYEPLLQWGKILYWGYSGGSARVWDPATNTITNVPAQSNIFCAGHALTPDGDAFVAGGNYISDTNIFLNPSQQWLRVADMNYDRFYPTVTTLPDGRIMAQSGYDLQWGTVDLGEIYLAEPDEWRLLPDDAAQLLPLYPFMFVLPDGNLVSAGPELATRVLDMQALRWFTVAASDFAGASAAMYEPGKILKSGGSNLARAAVIDFNLPSVPSWRTVLPMHHQRVDHDLTILPDGSVLAVGGTNSGGPVLDAEIFYPASGGWRKMAPMSVARGYHSTAILLPDGRVLAAGGGANQTGQIYSPPYLFWGPRPTITGALATITYGQEFRIFTGPDEAAGIQKVALVGLGAVTHSFDQNQRHVPLKFYAAGTNVLHATAPSSSNIAPPGHYMLFIIAANGAPSHARYIQIR
jgi:galactose oxidase